MKSVLFGVPISRAAKRACVTDALNAKFIEATTQQGIKLTPAVTGGFQLCSRAVGSVVRILGGSGNPGENWARDFLGSLLLEVMATAARPSACSRRTRPTTARVHAGDTAESLARQHYDENWRAAVPLLIAANDVQPKR